MVSEYSALSGYEVYWPKNKNIPLNTSCIHYMFQGPTTTWIQSGRKYLGIHFAPTLQGTLSLAHEAIAKIIKDTISKRSPLHRSWWGRQEAVKMVVVQRIHYIFSMIRVRFEKGAYRSFERGLTSFLWAGKTPRIDLWKLKLPKESGSLAFPILGDYHEAFIMRGLYHWFNPSRDMNTPRWVEWEQAAVGHFPLQIILEISGKITALSNQIVLDSKHLYQSSGTRQCRKTGVSYIPNIWFNPDILDGGKPIF